MIPIKLIPKSLKGILAQRMFCVTRWHQLTCIGIKSMKMNIGEIFSLVFIKHRYLHKIPVTDQSELIIIETIAGTMDVSF